MKSLFRRSAVLVLAVAFVLLTGCGGDDSNIRESSRDRHTTNEENRGGSNVDDTSDQEQGGGDNAENYPVIEAADYSDMELETISNSQMSYSFPAGEWMKILDNPLQIAWMETVTTTQAVNISVSLVSTSKLSKNWIDDALKELQGGFTETYNDAITIESMDVRTLDGEKVIYSEVVTKINDEMIDLLIEEGVYTEAQIEASGGREALLAIPPTTQIAIYAEKDGYGFVCTGTYYAEDQKQMVLDTMTIMLGTMEKK
ncbi:MAG: hypothetical protein J1E01_02705 [Acetatifactor sp.]|nr:hypothetical protein [Acetatifactor sp.]